MKTGPFSWFYQLFPCGLGTLELSGAFPMQPRCPSAAIHRCRQYLLHHQGKLPLRASAREDSCEGVEGSKGK